MSSSREDLCRVLQSSLNDAILGSSALLRVGSTALNSCVSTPGPNSLHQKPFASLSGGSSYSTFLPLHQGSLVARSLGGGPGFASTRNASIQSPPASSFLGIDSEDKLLLMAVAAANQRKKLLEKAQTSLLQQQIEEEQKRLFLGKSYLNMLRNETQAKSELGGFSLAGMQPLQVKPPPSSISREVTKKKALEALGSNLRSRTDPYIDISALADSAPEDSEVRRTRGGVAEPFPDKLHRMLEEVEKQGLSEAVSFFSHGRAFGVHDMDRFVSEIMPKYFKQTKWSSFARQLNLYGFIRISSGPDAGGYYHELFLKGKPSLAHHMRRVGVPQGEDRRKFRSKNKNVEPDFYSMKNIISYDKW